ncbi:MAG: Mutator MutT protein [Verrucomicrobiota bacterium]|jgi:mutator protein MutT
MTNSTEHAAGDLEPIRQSQFEIRNSIEVSAGLVFRAGQLLIAQRLSGGHLAGLWEFPGGKREPGEGFEDCLRRELQEELGVVVCVHEELERLTHSYPEKTVHLRFFRCTLADASAEPRALGCQAVTWVTREALANYTFPAADARLLERLGASEALWRVG